MPHLHAVADVRVATHAALQTRLAEVVRQGGDGMTLHLADAPYTTGSPRPPRFASVVSRGRFNEINLKAPVTPSLEPS